MAVTTRQALFEAAWERPLTEIAEDLGITSTGLKKICDRHDIPTPGRGYWAQVRAGKTFPRPKLRPLEDPRFDPVRLPGARPLPAVVESAMAAVREAVPRPRRTPRRTAPEPQPTPAQSTTAAEGAPTREPDTVAATTDPVERKDLAATRRAYARPRTDARGFADLSGKGVIRARLGTEAVDPALRFLERLLAAAEARGWRLVTSDAGAVMEVDGEKLAIRLEDRPKKVPHTPSRKELADQAQRERWGYSGQVWRRWDEVPSGRLALIIDENLGTGLRVTFSKRGGFPLEDSIPVIVEALAGHAAMKAETRRRRAEEARLYALAEARRKRIEAFRKREVRREEYVGLIADQLAARARLQGVLDHVRANDRGEPRKLARLEALLARRIGALDARLDPVALEISARHAEVGFAEPPPASDKPDWHYPPKPELHLWRLNAADDLFHSEDELEWAIAEGLIADPGAAPSADEPPI